MYQLQNIQTLKFAGVHVARVASEITIFIYLSAE